MKRIITLILIIAGSVLAANTLPNCTGGGVNSAQFIEKHEHLQKEIDSIKAELVDIKSSQKEMKQDLDTLKAGQKVIYNEVTKNEVSFIDKIKELWK